MTAETENSRHTMHGLAIVPTKDALEKEGLDGEGALARQVYRLIRRLVVDLILLPNQFLSEKDVAASLGISKTPVREAFIRLAEDGIVRIVPKSGTYVAPVDFERAKEGCFIWSALESSCAERAAEQCSMGDIRRLRDELGRMRQCADSGDAAGFAAAREAIHRVIYEAADLPDAEKLVEAARFEVDRVLHVVELRGRGPMPGVFAEYSDIVNAIALHQPEAARECVLRHMRRVQDIVSAGAGDGEVAALFAFLDRKRPGTRRSRAERG